MDVKHNIFSIGLSHICTKGWVSSTIHKSPDGAFPLEFASAMTWVVKVLVLLIYIYEEQIITHALW